VGQKILVVEDNELNLKLFCDLLRAHGYEAEPVRDGRDAVERARAFAPDLVVMDIQMPHVSGLELIEQMKADDGLRSTPIMAVTAYAARGDEERIRDAGAEGYVSKPISVLRFVEAVAGLLDAAVVRVAAPPAEVAEIAPEVDAEPILADADAEEGSDDAEAVAEATQADVEAAGQSVGDSPAEEPESLLNSRDSGNPGEKPDDGEEGEVPGSAPA
jgi:two-component system cell cycle response regulator DivK